MNDPYTSRDETNEVSTLFIQINKNNIAYWNKELDTSRHQSFEQQQDRPQDNQEQSFPEEQPEQSSFRQDILNHSLEIQYQLNRSLPLESRVYEPMLEVQEMLDYNDDVLREDRQGIKDREDNEINELDGMDESNMSCSVDVSCSLPSQITITLNEQSFASKVLQQFDTLDTSIFSNSLKSFLNITNDNYRPHINYMKFLFSKLKQHGTNTIKDLKQYIMFLQIKMKQEISSLQMIDNLQLTKVEIQNHELNMDEKAVMGFMISNTHQTKVKRKVFHGKMRELYEGLLDTWKRIKEKREKRQRFIEEELFGKLDRIELQMEDMIRCCLLNEKERAKDSNKHVSTYMRSESIYVKTDKYLQNKYLIERQKAFLSLIVELNGKVITYMINMLTKQEIPIQNSVRDAIIQYGQSYLQCYGSKNHNLITTITDLKEVKDNDELKQELANILFSFIPRQLYDIIQNVPNYDSFIHPLETILEKFCNHLQNNIFMPTIELNFDYILYKNEAIWKNTSSFIRNEEKVLDYESREVFNNSNASYMNNRANDLKMNSEDLKIMVVLTSNFYLHLQNECKVATIYLPDVKFTKKGKEIIIIQKPKDLAMFFWTKKQLGRLQFQNIAELQFFASKIAKALGKLMHTP